MKCFSIYLLLGLVSSIYSPVYGRIFFQRLSAREVYNVLREAGRMDAVPEGRIITQGIAAATGFLAGLTKGVGIPLLLGLGAFGHNNNSNSSPQTTTQEICFNSRSANEATNEEEGIGDDDDIPEGRQATGTSGTSGTVGSSPFTSATTIATPATIEAGPGTMLENGSGTGTDSETMTNTGSGATVNCIVVQKPV